MLFYLFRYLDPYEKTHFLHEEEDDNNDWADAEDSRLRNKRMEKIQGSVPSTYNYNQHNVARTDREAFGLSMNLYR